jgi:hypothetical protein
MSAWKPSMACRTRPEGNMKSLSWNASNRGNELATEPLADNVGVRLAEADVDGSRIARMQCTQSIKSTQRHQSNVSRDQRPKLELPPLPSLEEMHFFSVTGDNNLLSSTSAQVPATQQSSHPKPHHSLSWPSYSPLEAVAFSNPFGNAPPLTPPQEFDSFKFSTLESDTLLPRNQSLSSEQGASRPDITVQQTSSSTARPSTISLPGFPGMSEQSTSPSTWLDRAVHTIGECPSKPPIAWHVLTI